MTTTLKSFRDQGKVLDYKAPLRLSMLADGTIDAMFEDGFGPEDPRDEDLKPRSPEEQNARAATKEYCLKYLDRFFTEGGAWEDLGGAWEDLGSLSISLCMFYDGYLSAIKGEVATYN